MKMGHHCLETLALLGQLWEARSRRENGQAVPAVTHGGGRGPEELPAQPRALPEGRQHPPVSPQEPPPA